MGLGFRTFCVDNAVLFTVLDGKPEGVAECFNPEEPAVDEILALMGELVEITVSEYVTEIIILLLLDS